MSIKRRHPRGVPVEGYQCREHPLYFTWTLMWERCTNPKNPGWKNYGGRGIKVCERWGWFANFVVDMGPKPDARLTLERTDNNAGYSPSNCVWATRSDQCVNRRTFSNNSTGFDGVVLISNGRYEARFDYENVRYSIGRFSSAEDASNARAEFLELFFSDRARAVESISDETLWCTSSSSVRGVTPHKDGGYIARCTVGGVRHYLGYFKTIDEAAYARSKFLEG